MTQTPTTSLVVDLPKSVKPDVIIPREIAQAWANYSKIAHEDYNSEWGCIARGVVEEDGRCIRVAEYKPLRINASMAYWEAMPGEQEAHMQYLLNEGREAELGEWNVLFHSHPVNSGASMSGTDVTQLKELAGTNWFGVSIIAPATREGVIEPLRWMVHLADSRWYGGEPMVVRNHRPIIGDVDPQNLDAIREEMKGLMHKELPRHNSGKNWNTGRGSRSGNVPYSQEPVWPNQWKEDPNTGTWVKEEEAPWDYGDLLSLANKPTVGDWVRLMWADPDELNLYGLSPKQMSQYLECEQAIMRITKMEGKRLRCGGFWFDPVYVENVSEDGDWFEMIARKGSPRAGLLAQKAGSKGIVHETARKLLGSGGVV